MCRFLDKAVAVILAFIGGKMILDEIPGSFHVSTTQSLLFVATTLGVGVVSSLLFPEKPPVEESTSQNGSLPVPVERVGAKTQDLEAKVKEKDTI
jgi:predicted tellurium resistance membrane protein TerC